MSKLFDKSWNKKTEFQRFETLVDWVHEVVWGTERRPSKPKRARTKTGTYRADDKSTKALNEAWVGGKAPKRRKSVGTKKKTTKRTKK